MLLAEIMPCGCIQQCRTMATPDGCMQRRVTPAILTKSLFKCWCHGTVGGYGSLRLSGSRHSCIGWTLLLDRFLLFLWATVQG
ncbi:hypothetical protein RRG08_021564 [Elysia crispata]|uniref:Uncharacterized protein n=1 Tax=Elysia crispata TaxID=231223 RepID=A0AAE1CER1_9GAST|nr:hypothetical protein RRG08_021564 [Elysia crispata]